MSGSEDWLLAQPAARQLFVILLGTFSVSIMVRQLIQLKLVREVWTVRTHVALCDRHRNSLHNL